MLDLREYARRPKLLCDYLPWAALVAPGVVLNKDGSFQRTAGFRGPDLESVGDAEVAAVGGAFEQRPASAGFGLGDLHRGPPRPGHGLSRQRLSRSGLGPGRRERRQAFLEEGAHFESSYFLTLIYLPPAERTGRLENLFVEGRERGRRRLARPGGRLHRPLQPTAGPDPGPDPRGRTGSMTARP
jgi:type IV secretory pathway VirB4 component